MVRLGVPASRGGACEIRFDDPDDTSHLFWVNDDCDIEVCNTEEGNQLSLSVSERIHLVEDIWDTIAEVPDEVGLTDEQKAELDRRLAAYHQNPDEGPRGAGAGTDQEKTMRFFLEDDERIVILAVFHSKRDPRCWTDRT